MKPIYEDKNYIIYPPDDEDEIRVFNYNSCQSTYYKRKIVEAMAKAFGLIPTLSDTDEVLPEAIFD